jgi:prepilin-type N-terminal cleavage/methylation domain-containing protein
MNNKKGFSLIELLIVVAIILIIAAIAIPNLLRSRMSANQAAAAATVRNINNSQAAYIAEFGSPVGYSDTLAKLGQGAPCDATHACLLDEVLGCAAEPCAKGGYSYFMTSLSKSAPIGDYTATATPRVMGTSGQINYCAADDGVIRQEIVPTVTLGAGLGRLTCVDTTKYTAIQ